MLFDDNLKHGGILVLFAKMEQVIILVRI